MTLFHHDDRLGRFAQLLERAFDGRVPDGWEGWRDALGDPDRLELFFEVNLPSPPSYKEGLAHRLDRVAILPWVRARGVASRNLEGATKLDALLLASTGVAVAFEAKVLSDLSKDTHYDATRNQLARIVDVVLEPNRGLLSGLDERDPEQTYVVLLTPELFRSQPRSRLYGHLFHEYRSNPTALREDLPHRDAATIEKMSERLGWATWEECEDVVTGACRWLSAEVPAPRDGR
ncbi:hypothetical protein [Aquipuribacter nitratireducens]|uniref:Uncharacterized protein n=1 Tax=Aquipuribacter nitratireducens TaxID=650104 RepID=A0ABW0GHC9_9MICO